MREACFLFLTYSLLIFPGVLLLRLKIHLAIEFMIATQFQVNVHTFENRMIHFAFFQFGMQVICVKSIVCESVYQIWALAMILID